jgi:hypothetical protein
MALEIQSLTLEQETIDSKAKPVTMISTLSSYSLALQQFLHGDYKHILNVNKNVDI